MVKRKAILKKAVARNARAVKIAGIKKRMQDAFQGIPRKDPGMIHLDPREWGAGGGFVKPGFPSKGGGYDKPVSGDDGFFNIGGEFPGFPPNKGGGYDKPVSGDDGYFNIGGDPRDEFMQAYQRAEENRDRKENFDNVVGHFQEQRKSHDFEHIKDNMRKSLQNFRGQPPTSGGGGVGSNNPGDGMIHLDPREWGGNGGFPGRPHKPMPMPGRPRPMPMPPRGDWHIPSPMPGGPRPGMGIPSPMPGGPRPPGGGGMIHLDPREWGGNGGFNQSPKPSLGGGRPIPMPSPGNMPMPNPKRNLIPRPMDPRYKAF